MVTGFDRNSVAPALKREEFVHGAVSQGAANFSCATPYVEFKDGAVITQMTCPPIEGVDRDFLGDPMPKGEVLPGPFQTFAEGYNQFVLDPVEPDGDS